MENYEERLKLIAETKRVIKKDGIIFFSIINNDMVIITQNFQYSDGNYLVDKKLFDDEYILENDPFVFHTLDKFKEMLVHSNLNIMNIVAQDGISELISDRINSLNDEQFKHWFNYHIHICDDENMIGLSNHNLFICKK